MFKINKILIFILIIFVASSCSDHIQKYSDSLSISNLNYGIREIDQKDQHEKILEYDLTVTNLSSTKVYLIKSVEPLFQDNEINSIKDVEKIIKPNTSINIKGQVKVNDLNLTITSINIVSKETFEIKHKK